MGNKLTDPDEFRSYLRTDTLQHPTVSELLVLDVTHLTPEEAAARIENHIDVIGLSKGCQLGTLAASLRRLH